MEKFQTRISSTSELKDLYSESLRELNSLHEPAVFYSLVEIAKENIHQAAIVAECIQMDLLFGDFERKLQIFNLMDCILKTIGKDYIEHFQSKIVTIVGRVYDCLPEYEQKQLKDNIKPWYSLPGGLLFPGKILHEIESDISIKLVRKLILVQGASNRLPPAEYLDELLDVSKSNLKRKLEYPWENSRDISIP
jgi:hypothetical protein